MARRRNRRSAPPAGQRVSAEDVKMVNRSRRRIFSRGLQLFVKALVLRLCYDCCKKYVIMRFNEETDRYEGTRICYICTQSYKRKTGSFIA